MDNIQRENNLLKNLIYELLEDPDSWDYDYFVWKCEKLGIKKDYIVPCGKCGEQPSIGYVDLLDEWIISCRNGSCIGRLTVTRGQDKQDVIDRWNEKNKVEE